MLQATLSVVLVAGSTMLGRSLGNLEGQDFGFTRARPRARDRRPAVGVDRRRERLTALYRDLEERLARIPGVKGAGLALYNPLTNNWGEGVLIAGKPQPAPGEQTGASWDRVSANYLQQLGVKLVRGRHFTAADNETAENVAVVNEAFVRRFFKAGRGSRSISHFGLNLPENVNSFRIVGVVGDARFAGFQLDRPMRPMFFVPLAQTVNYANEMMKRVETASHYVGGLLLVTDTAPGALEPQVARALAEADPNLAVINIRTLEDQIARTFDPAARGREPRRPVRRDRAGAGRHWPLRRHVVLGGPPHERDRRPHGARRRSPARSCDSCWAARSGASRLACCSGCRWPSAPAICSPRSSTTCRFGIPSRSASAAVLAGRGRADRVGVARGACRGAGADAGAADELTHIGGPAHTPSARDHPAASGDKCDRLRGL